jgi:hypothetical protein
MATPVNPAYQLDAFQEFERHLPPTWFRQLHQRQGPLYPVVWALCGAIAGARESIDSARSMAIPQTSEGFWLSLHLLGLGLNRRSAESDAQARTRYRFEFSQSRNTRQGLQLSLTTFSGLPAANIRLETNFASGEYGQLSLTVNTASHWTTVEWWWLADLFTKWIANGINSKASLTTQGLRTVALPPWDYYTRFPVTTDLLKPFWQRPAFANELRLVNFTQIFEERAFVELGSYSLPAAISYDAPNLSTASYLLPVDITPIDLVPISVLSSDVSRNVLGFICQANWNDQSLRMSEIWRSLTYAQQPGQPFFYLGDPDTCDRLLVNLPAPPTVAFPGDSVDQMTGKGPWQLQLGNSQVPVPRIQQPFATLEPVAQWWTDADLLARSPTPLDDPEGDRFLMLEFLLPKTTTGETIRQLELLLGYEAPQYGAALGWSLPSSPDEWLVPVAGSWQLVGGTDAIALNTQFPVQQTIHFRQVNLPIPPDVNMGFLVLVQYSLSGAFINLWLDFEEPLHSFTLYA